MDKYDKAMELICQAMCMGDVKKLDVEHRNNLLGQALKILDELRPRIEEAMGCLSSEEEDDGPEMPDNVMSEITVYHKDGSTETLLELKKEIERKHADKTSP